MASLYSDKTYHFYCMFCGKEFKSFSSRADHEDVCKEVDSLTIKNPSKKWWQSGYNSLPKPQQQKTKAPAKSPSAIEHDKNTYSTYQQHTHHQWVRIGKYQVLAMSLGGANGVEKEVDYQVVMAQSYLYAGSVLMNYESKFQRHQQERLIYVVWPDMGIIPSKDYEALLDYLERLLAGGKKVAVGCLGGHGRTGTILAGLVKRIEHLSANQAIDSLRKRYCHSAVETKSQEDLVAGKTFQVTSATPIKNTQSLLATTEFSEGDDAEFLWST